MLSSFAQFSLRRGRVPPSPCCKFFIWLAIKNRCWTADQLAKRGKEVSHTLLLAPFVTKKMNCATFVSLLHLYLPGLVYNPTEAQPGLGCSSAIIKFSSWWCQALKGAPKGCRKGINSLIILVSWEIWKHRNDCL